MEASFDGEGARTRWVGYFEAFHQRVIEDLYLFRILAILKELGLNQYIRTSHPFLVFQIA